jgi:hypothetical protein
MLHRQMPTLAQVQKLPHLLLHVAVPIQLRWLHLPLHLPTLQLVLDYETQWFLEQPVAAALGLLQDFVQLENL